MPTKAVIFDCFGVLATDGWLPFRDEHFNDKPDLLEQAIASNKRVDAGLQSYDGFVSEVATLAGVPEATARFHIEHNIPNATLLSYIRDTIAPTYKVGFLSNAGANWLNDIFEPWQVSLFDEVLLSYQIGAIKPDAIMYTTIATRLGVLPEECIFIDDQPRYVQGAIDVGMAAIHYKDNKQLLLELTDVLNARAS